MKKPKFRVSDTEVHISDTAKSLYDLLARAYEDPTDRIVLATLLLGNAAGNAVKLDDPASVDELCRTIGENVQTLIYKVVEARQTSAAAEPKPRPYLEGWKAYIRGCGRYDNPYSDDTPEFAAYDLGFLDAKNKEATAMPDPSEVP